MKSNLEHLSDERLQARLVDYENEYDTISDPGQQHLQTTKIYELMDELKRRGLTVEDDAQEQIEERADDPAVQVRIQEKAARIAGDGIAQLAPRFGDTVGYHNFLAGLSEPEKQALKHDKAQQDAIRQRFGV